MPFSPDLVEELNVLARYNLTTTQEGIKVHKNADPAMIDTIKRMYEKGLLTQVDGGYLTDLGREAAEHAQITLTILASSSNH
jgi:uncharacterized protein (TIGR02647 family)